MYAILAIIVQKAQPLLNKFLAQWVLSDQFLKEVNLRIALFALLDSIVSILELPILLYALKDFIVRLGLKNQSRALKVHTVPQQV